MAERKRCTQVRMFDINNRILGLFIDLNTDATFVVDENADEIGLEFDSGTKIHYKGKNIGRIQMSFDKVSKNLQFIKYSESAKEISCVKHGTRDSMETVIDTGIDQDKVECYLDAEVFITKYLIENNIITLED